MTSITSHKPSVRGLARQLSLSVGTISRALNNDPNIRAQTRDRVLKAAAEAGYVPNQQARSLRMQKTQRLGILLPSLVNPYYAQKVASAQQAAWASGYDIAFACTEWNPSYTASAFRHLISQGVDALVIMDDLPTLSSGSDNPLAFAEQRGIPMLLLTNAIPAAVQHRVAHYDRLSVNTTQGVRLAIEHLLALGHRRLGLLGIDARPGASEAHRLRREAAGVVLAEAGLSLVDCPTVMCHSGQSQSAYDAMEVYLSQTAASDRPTAWLAVDDQVALGAMAQWMDRGLHVPGDVSVVGFDNTVNARFCRPCLTTVSQTHADMGRLAVEMLLERIERPDAPARHVRLSPTLVAGQSSGPAR